MSNISLLKIIEKLRSIPTHVYTLLRNRNKYFTIISNDCWAAEVYIDTNIQYLTPFVGLMLMAPCYIKLLQNLEIIKTKKLTFIEKSKYPLNISKSYPIGLIDDIEIHFLHYENEEEALSKWERRIKRMNWDNLFIKFDGSKDFATQEHLKIFNELPFRNKVCFVKEKFDYYDSVIKISEWNSDGKLMYRICHKEFDVIGWINNQVIRTNRIIKVFYSLLYRPM